MPGLKITNNSNWNFLVVVTTKSMLENMLVPPAFASTFDKSSQQLSIRFVVIGLPPQCVDDMYVHCKQIVNINSY